MAWVRGGEGGTRGSHCLGEGEGHKGSHSLPRCGGGVPGMKAGRQNAMHHSTPHTLPPRGHPCTRHKHARTQSVSKKCVTHTVRHTHMYTRVFTHAHTHSHTHNIHGHSLDLHCAGGCPCRSVVANVVREEVEHRHSAAWLLHALNGAHQARQQRVRRKMAGTRCSRQVQAHAARRKAGECVCMCGRDCGRGRAGVSTGRGKGGGGPCGSRDG